MTEFDFIVFGSLDVVSLALQQGTIDTLLWSLTPGFVNVVGSNLWADYRFAYKIRFTQSGTAQAYFRYQDANNHYYLDMSSSALTLKKRFVGVLYTIATIPTPIVINTDYTAKLRVTGRKAERKVYYRHSGYPGGLKETNFAKLQAAKPTRVLQHAVKGMLPKGPLGYAMLRKLKVYAGATHPHSAQQPKNLEI